MYASSPGVRNPCYRTYCKAVGNATFFEFNNRASGSATLSESVLFSTWSRHRFFLNSIINLLSGQIGLLFLIQLAPGFSGFEGMLSFVSLLNKGTVHRNHVDVPGSAHREFPRIQTKRCQTPDSFCGVGLPELSVSTQVHGNEKSAKT